MTNRKSHTRPANALVSIVMPVFNEAGILHELTRTVVDVMERAHRRFEVVYVNDGSSDASEVILSDLAEDDNRIVVVHLSRNFGQQPALQAGLRQAQGDAVIVMDSDLQDKPDAIPDFLAKWEDGYDVVYAERFNRKESAPKRFLFYCFYRILNAVADFAIPQDAGNFGLMDRCVVNALVSMPECDRWFPGLRTWVGFRQTGVPVERNARYDDEARVSLVGLFRLAKTALFSFSAFPLTLFYFIAALSTLVCAASTGFVVYHKIVTGLAVSGWASVIVTASFFGALNALGISVLGEYVIRIYDQVRSRPIQIVERVVNSNTASSPGHDNVVHSQLVDSDSQEAEVLEMLQQIDKTLRVRAVDTRVSQTSGR